VRLTFDESLDATPDEVLRVLTDPRFQDAKCAATSEGGTYSVDIRPGTAGPRVTTHRDLPADGLPDVARSFVGDRLTIVEVLDWSAVVAGHSAWLELHVKGAPLTLKGRLTLATSGATTTKMLGAELKANVPFIGSRVERAAADPIRAAIDIESGLLREWLARA
jgi:hypothetical protein